MKSWPCLPRDGLISVTLDMTGGQKTSKYDVVFFNCDFFFKGSGSLRWDLCWPERVHQLQVQQ